MVAACQGYPFEIRIPQSVTGSNIKQLVATVAPTDILFVIDDSGSMKDERAELANNISSFIEQLSETSGDFHVGIVTTDVECNVPEQDCTGPQTSLSCCGIVTAANLAPCQELDSNNDGKVDWSNCDGGRLRAPRGKPAYWTTPTAVERTQWSADFSQTIQDLGCNGSGLESGFEAARRAVNCSVFGYDPDQPSRCPSATIAQLNAGFVRAEADLVVIFVTDEDDCSFQDPNVYLRPPDPTSASDQGAHLCGPPECYAYYGKDDHIGGSSVQAWADSNNIAGPSGGYYQCEGNSRGANPPYPDDPNLYINALVAAKNGQVRRVRASGILSGLLPGTPNPTDALHGFAASGCFGVSDTAPPSNACGCWSASAVLSNSPTTNFYCALTGATGSRLSTATPPHAVSNECSAIGAGSSSAPQPGCNAMPGARYVSFLESLAATRKQALVRADTLADSICKTKYDTTMFDIVNNVILSNCFGLGAAAPSADDIQVSLNGVVLFQVPVGSANPGWSYAAGSQEICLEGGLHKNLGDQFDIFVLTATTQ